jgi:hypothetical protein
VRPGQALAFTRRAGEKGRGPIITHKNLLYDARSPRL